jgi:hypothetical protein
VECTDKITYGNSILGVHKVIQAYWKCLDNMILGYFSTVGLLFWNQTRIISQYPEIKPLYNDPNLSPYNGHFDILEMIFLTDMYHLHQNL